MVMKSRISQTPQSLEYQIFCIKEVKTEKLENGLQKTTIFKMCLVCVFELTQCFQTCNRSTTHLRCQGLFY